MSVLKSIVCVCLVLFFAGCATATEVRLGQADRVSVVVPPKASPVMRRAAAILLHEIKQRCPKAAWTINGENKADKLTIRFVLLPQSPDDVKDAYQIKTDLTDPENHFIEISTSTPRAALYAAGELLRKSSIDPETIIIPVLNAKYAPYFPVRGFRDAGPMPFRGEHLPKFRTYMEDVALWGGNIFVEERNWVRTEGFFEIIDSIGFDLGLYFPTNAIRGVGRLVNPNLPENRARLLKQFEDFANSYPHLELWSSATVDNGGWFSADCLPWGKTHTLLMAEEAAVLRKKHPQLKTLLQYQITDKTGEELKWLQQYAKSGEAKKWLDSFSPPIISGGAAEEAYTFEFLLNNGIKPAYADMATHWDKQSFNPESVVKPPFDKAIWNRGLLLRTIWSRRGGPALMPRRIKGMIDQLVKWKGLGAAPYNHGSLHDDIQKYYMVRLLFDPTLSLEEISNDFGRFYFGPKGAELVGQAMLLMEMNWARAVNGNEDIEKVYELVQRAYDLSPSSYQEHNWRRDALLYRAIGDKLAQLAIELDPSSFEDAFHAQIMSAADSEKRPAEALARGIEFLKKWKQEKIKPLVETYDRLLKESVRLDRRVGEEIVWHQPGTTAILHRMKSTKWIGSYQAMFERALTSGNKIAMLKTVANTLNYQYAGEDGFYNYSSDDTGRKRKNLVDLDNRFDVSTSPKGFSSSHPWRLSQRLSAGKQVAMSTVQTLRYDGLGKKKTYRLKLSNVGGNSGAAGNRILLNGQLFIPAIYDRNPRQYVFDIPVEFTQTGKLEIMIETSGYSLWRGMTECWLYEHKKGETDIRLPFDIKSLNDDIALKNADAADSRSLIFNGDFEGVSSPGAIGLMGWGYVGSKIPVWRIRGPRVRISSDEPLSGKRCLELGEGNATLTYLVKYPAENAKLHLSLVTDVPEGCGLNITLKGQDIFNRALPVTPSRRISGGNSKKQTVNLDWQLPEDVKFIEVVLQSKVARNKTIRIDDVVLTQTKPQNLQKPGASKDWKLVYEDNFDREKIGSNWRSTRGKWQIKDGKLVGSGRILYANKIVGDQRIVYTASSQKPCDLAALLCTDPLKGESGYGFYFASNWNTVSKLLINMALIKKYDVVAVPGKEHTIVCESSGNRLIQYVDGKKVLDIYDFKPLRTRENRWIGLAAFDASIANFDSIKIYRK